MQHVSGNNVATDAVPTQQPASPPLHPTSQRFTFRSVAPPPLSLSHSNVDPDGRTAAASAAANHSDPVSNHEVLAEGDVGLGLSTVQSYVVIISLIPGGSALASGNLKVGDLISSINGVEHNGSVALAHELLKGPAYSHVHLSVIRFDPYGAALSTEIFLQRLPSAPAFRSLNSLIPHASSGQYDTPRKLGTPLSTSRTSASQYASKAWTPRATPRAGASSLALAVPVEPIPLAATVMNPANVVGFVVKLDHPYYRILEDIRRKLVPSSMQRSTVLQSVTEMDFRDVFSSETEAGEFGMSYREFSPRVFSLLRHFWRVDTQDFLDAFVGSASALPFFSHSEERRGLDACGSVFYCPTGRFVLKFIGEAEFQWLLDLLPSYYNHFHEMHEQNIVRFTSQYANSSVFSIMTTYVCSFLSSEDFFAKDLLHLSHSLQRQAAVCLRNKQCTP